MAPSSPRDRAIAWALSAVLARDEWVEAMTEYLVYVDGLEAENKQLKERVEQAERHLRVWEDGFRVTARRSQAEIKRLDEARLGLVDANASLVDAGFEIQAENERLRAEIDDLKDQLRTAHLGYDD